MTISSAVSGAPQLPIVPTERDVASNNRAVSAAVRVLNGAGFAGDANQFSVAIDPTTRQAVVRIVNSSTNELVEQLPSEYILGVAQDLSARIAKQASAASDKTLSA